MATIGRYCKSYPLSRLRQFPGWHEKPENARRVKKEVNGEVVEGPRQLTDDDYVYLHGDFTVTDGIFIDENIIFDDVTLEWREFCQSLVDITATKESP